MHKDLIFLKGVAKGKGFYQLMKSIKAAVVFHDGQMRKSGEKYETHPMRVTSTLYSLGIIDDIILSAAMLHDAIEDTAANRSNLINEYGISPEVVDLVEMVTKNDKMSCETYYRNIRSDIRAILIKVADRLHNVSTMFRGFKIKKIREYIYETRQYVLPLCKYSINFYPEYADPIVVMRNAIESMVDAAECFVKVLDESLDEMKLTDLKPECFQYNDQYLSF